MGMARITFSWSVWSSLLRKHKRSEGGNDETAYIDALYRQYYPSVLAFLCFLVGTPEVAEDLASIVFEKAMTHLVDIHTPEAVGAWLFRIARNCATDYFRRCKPTISLEQLVLEEHPQTAALEESIVASEEKSYLLTHLKQLSEREREVIGLKFVAGLNNREIAGVLQIPEGTVGSLLHRTLRRLRTMLKEEGAHDEA
ncbi:MAG: RNA polymerase sigma factor [Ktedonobacteraceae bacterium]